MYQRTPNRVLYYHIYYVCMVCVICLPCGRQSCWRESLNAYRLRSSSPIGYYTMSTPPYPMSQFTAQLLLHTKRAKPREAWGTGGGVLIMNDNACIPCQSLALDLAYQKSQTQRGRGGGVLIIMITHATISSHHRPLIDLACQQTNDAGTEGQISCST